jgi:hypothetical protein
MKILFSSYAFLPGVGGIETVSAILAPAAVAIPSHFSSPVVQSFFPKQHQPSASFAGPRFAEALHRGASDLDSKRSRRTAVEGSAQKKSLVARNECRD